MRDFVPEWTALWRRVPGATPHHNTGGRPLSTDPGRATKSRLRLCTCKAASGQRRINVRYFFCRAFLRNCWSPTPIHSSSSTISPSTAVATAKIRRSIMPLE